MLFWGGLYRVGLTFVFPRLLCVIFFILFLIKVLDVSVVIYMSLRLNKLISLSEVLQRGDDERLKNEC